MVARLVASYAYSAWQQLDPKVLSSTIHTIPLVFTLAETTGDPVAKAKLFGLFDVGEVDNIPLLPAFTENAFRLSATPPSAPPP